ncbi:hypothetical protein D1007_44590 [Hordeum vulgare]|nr:hypothetical protein D1007_44590 [Hordeum vulgare]
MEGMLRSLRLSEAEKAGLRIGGKRMEATDGERTALVEAEALGIVLSEKAVSAEGVTQALGKIWCPLRGIRCRKMVVDFDPNKALEEYVFNWVPISVQVLKVPLGRMDRAEREMIGEKVGAFVDVEVGEDGMAEGESLRIKVKLDITKPLMRGTVIHTGDDERVRWCPFRYEYLREFCYICGIIGHEEKNCSVSLTKGEEKQFGSWLRAYIPRK